MSALGPDTGSDSAGVFEKADPTDVAPHPVDLDRSFSHGIAWVGSVKWIVQLVTWAVTIVVARILSPADYGLLAMGAVFFTFVTLLSESGIGTTVITIPGLSRKQIAQINGAALLFGVAGALITAAAAYPVGWFFNSTKLPPVIAVMSISLVISAFQVVPGSLLRKDLRFRRVAIIEAGRGIFQAGVTLLLAILGFAYWSLVLSALGGTLLATIALVYSHPVTIRWPSRRELSSVIPFTRHVLIGRLFWYSYQDSDFLVAGKRLGKDALGAYSYAWTLASMPIDKIAALVGSLTPAIFAAVQTDVPALRRYFSMVVEGIALLTAPLNIGLALVAADLVPIVFGEKWRSMVLPLRILAFYAPVRAIYPPTSQVLMVTGDSRFAMYMNGIAAVMLPTAFLIGSQWGTAGIALAWCVAHPILFVVTVGRVLSRLEMTVADYFRAVRPAMLGCFAMTAAVLAVGYLLRTAPGGVRLAGEIASGAIAYPAYLFLAQRDRLTALAAMWRQRPA